MDTDSDSDGSHVSATPPGTPVYYPVSRPPLPKKVSSVAVSLGSKAKVESKPGKSGGISAALHREPSEVLKTQLECTSRRSSIHSPVSRCDAASLFDSLPFRIRSAPVVEPLGLETLPAGYFSKRESFSKLSKRETCLRFESADETGDDWKDSAIKKPKVVIPNLIGATEPLAKVTVNKSIRNDGNFVKMNLNGKGSKKFRNLNRKKGGYSNAKRKFRRNT